MIIISIRDKSKLEDDKDSREAIRPYNIVDNLSDIGLNRQSVIPNIFVNKIPRLRYAAAMIKVDATNMPCYSGFPVVKLSIYHLLILELDNDRLERLKLGVIDSVA